MDLREYFEDNEELLKVSQEGQDKLHWNAIPCILAEDSDGHTCVLQPVLKAKVTDKNGKVTHVDMPLLKDVPVMFPQGGGYTLTFPLKKGDEALVTFASRNIDTWHQSGGTQQQLDDRMHHLNDGIAHVGLRSNPRKLSPAPSKTGTQLRSDDGKTFVEADNGKVTCKAPTEVLLINPDGTLVSVTPGRVDLGDYHGSKVLTVAGPSRKVYAVV